MKQLNKAQQKLVEENHNLIWSFMNKNHLSENAVEDWYGTCAEGLCKAAMIYNPDKNIKFNTLAYVCIKNEMIKVLDKKSKEETCLSLDYYFDESECYLKDCIPNNHDDIGELEFYSIFERCFNRLSDREKEIINACINVDGNFNDVANRLGVTKQRVNAVYNDFFNKFYSNLYGSEVKRI